MFSPQTPRDCAGAGPYNSFYPMYHHSHPAAAQAGAGGYPESAAAAHLALPYGQYPGAADAGYWDNYRSVIGGYGDWSASQAFGGGGGVQAGLAAPPGTPSPQQCAAVPAVVAGRNDSPDSGIVTGAAGDLPLTTGGAGGELTPAAGYPRPQHQHAHHHQQHQQHQQQQQQQQAQQAQPPQPQPQPARDSWEWLDRNSYPTTTRPPPGKTRTKDKYRVVYSDAQRLELEKEFRYNNYITIKRKLELSRILGLTDRQVKIWFQNRRAKERKQKRRMEETAKKHLIDLQQGGAGGGGGARGNGPTAPDMQLGALSHGHLEGVHGLVPLHRQTPVSVSGGGGDRYPRYSLPPELAAPGGHQHHQQHQHQHQQLQLVTKSEPRDGEPPAF